MSTIRFSTFPRTEPPPEFVASLIQVFEKHETSIATIGREKGLTSDTVLVRLRHDLEALGFDVEQGKTIADKIKRRSFSVKMACPRCSTRSMPFIRAGSAAWKSRPDGHGWAMLSIVIWSRPWSW